jgi:hypothetical protein
MQSLNLANKITGSYAKRVAVDLTEECVCVFVHTTSFATIHIHIYI